MRLQPLHRLVVAKTITPSRASRTLTMRPRLLWGLQCNAQVLRGALFTSNAREYSQGQQDSPSNWQNQTDEMRLNVKTILSLMLMATLSGCGLTMVSEDVLQRGSADGVSFKTTGRPTYDKVWSSAMTAMGTGMTIVESHKPSGTIKSRVGSAPTGKVVAFFITPTTPTAPEYTIELVSKKPRGFGLPEHRNWEPSVIEDFTQALGSR
jgi:hypothetical protein